MRRDDRAERPEQARVFNAANLPCLPYDLLETDAITALLYIIRMTTSEVTKRASDMSTSTRESGSVSMPASPAPNTTSPSKTILPSSHIGRSPEGKAYREHKRRQSEATEQAQRDALNAGVNDGNGNGTGMDRHHRKSMSGDGNGDFGGDSLLEGRRSNKQQQQQQQQQHDTERPGNDTKGFGKILKKIGLSKS